MSKKDKYDPETIKRTLARMPEDYEPNIEKFSYKDFAIRTIVNSICLIATPKNHFTVRMSDMKL